MSKLLPAYSFLSDNFTFLWRGVISTSLTHWRNLDVFIELSKLMHRSVIKKSTFTLNTLIGISEFWDAAFPFKFKISLSISASQTSKNWSLKHIFIYFQHHLCQDGFFLYFKIAFTVAPLRFCIKESESRNLEMLRFWKTFWKKESKTLAVFVSVAPFSDKFISSLCDSLWDSKGLTLFLNRLSSVTFSWPKLD